MGWLNDVSVRRASLGTASETASPGTGRNSLDQPVAAKLPDPLAAGRATRAAAARAAARHIPPYPYPSET